MAARAIRRRTRGADARVLKLLHGLDEDPDGLRTVENADFAGATFARPVDFSEVRLCGGSFRGATFEENASFEGAHFESTVDFAGAKFRQRALFEGAVFHCPAVFEYVEGTEEISGGAEVEFADWADFRRVQFRDGANFGGARFRSRARFDGATFGTSRARVAGSFVGASFLVSRTFGPMLGWGVVILDRVTFDAPVRIRVAAPEVLCRDAQFRARTSIEIRFAGVDLRDAEFAQPSVVGGFEDPFPELQHGDELARALARKRPGGWKPKIRSVDRANVGNLTLSKVDLRDCVFAGAHNLDGLRFEGADFPTVRNTFRFHRRAIREELDLPDGRPDLAERHARVYRALRKGREDNKDEPGAADFYYGEMEMRRKARRRLRETGSEKRTSWIEWGLLWLYKVFSGYGLRASRAGISLLVTIAVAAVLFAEFDGFDPDLGFGKSFLFSAESTSGLFRAPRPPEGLTLNDEGHVYQMGLRLLGPLFLGLAILAVRGRVKR